jgi:antirestriction protein ArdC
MPKKIRRAPVRIMSYSIYKRVTDAIISKLESAGSWQKLWATPAPINMNGRPYNGINFLLLSSFQYEYPVYGTFNQIRMNGGQVKKGEKATQIVFWGQRETIDPYTGKKETSWILRFYHVFNVAQADFDDFFMYKIKSLCPSNDNKVIPSAHEIFDSFEDAPALIHDNSGRASYSRVIDRIRIPKLEYFASSNEYYLTLFHEMIHSTGHVKRLDRFSSYKDFEDTHMRNYSREELVAELGAAYLANLCGLDINLDNSASYIDGWSKVLKDKVTWITWAASKAQEASNFIFKPMEVTA